MTQKDLALLERLCKIHAPSGNEAAMKEFILNYVDQHQEKWLTTPELFQNEALQDCIILKFGRPRTAIFAHMDSVGFTVRYENQLIPIGGPHPETGNILTGEDSLGPIACELTVTEGHKLLYHFGRAIDTGTDLVYQCHFRNHSSYIMSSCLDNRLGVFNALKVAETLEDGVLVFSCWEEHGGGSVPYLAKYIYENWQIKQALISDITWVTEGVYPGKGVVISLRDKNIPRKAFLNKVIQTARQSGIDFQVEVEAFGSSDGRELQESPYPIDWCFIGAPEDHVHSADEKVDKYDIKCMTDMYAYLMRYL